MSQVTDPSPVEIPVPDPLGTFGDQFDRVAAIRGDEVALSGSTGSVTYRTLAAVCEGWRVWCHANRITRIDPVAVSGSDETAMSLAVAVLHFGQPLVLVDALQPPARIRHVLAASGAQIVLAEPAAAAVIGEAVADGGGNGETDVPPLETVDTEWLERLATPTPVVADTSSEVDCDDPGSIVYTSGSTGLPKGVTLTQGAVVNGAAISRAQFGLTTRDVLALVLPPAYAAGQEILFAGVLNGCRVAVRDLRIHPVRQTGEWLESAGVTTLHLTPSLLRHLTGALTQRAFTGVRLVTTCGEAAHGGDVMQARDWLPRARYANYLGSSETGHLSFFHAAAGDAIDGPVPAGRVVAGKTITAVDADGSPRADGEAGRLVVTGRHLATGYWRDPDGTAAVFSTLDDGTRTFVTGDRGIVHADGRLELRGRNDDAVKIRGYMVEPAEVEAVLRRQPDVADAVVVVDREGDPRLVAYVVPQAGARPPSLATLRRGMGAELPLWMVPQAVMLLEGLPLTERGKVDRGALPHVPRRAEFDPPRDRWEVLVARHWGPVLGITDLSRDDDFFALGGDSLSVEEVMASLEDEGIRMIGADLATAPTLRQFARLVAARRGDGRSAREPRHVVRIRRADDARSSQSEGAPRVGPGGIYCFAGAGGHAYLFSDLIRALEVDDLPITAFQVRGLDGTAVPDWSVTATAKRYLRTIHGDLDGARSSDPARGPLILIGHSLGGLFALETAHRLSEAGHRVDGLVLLDTVLPGHLARRSGQAVPRVRIAGMEDRQSRAGLWWMRAKLLGAGWFPFPPKMRDEVLFEHGLRLTERYHPEPWDGVTEVFLSSENIDSRGWWSHVLTGDHRLVELPCDHVGVLKPPWVDQVARAVRGMLERAR